MKKALEIDALLIWHAKITEKTAKKLRKCEIAVKFGIGYEDQVNYEEFKNTVLNLRISFLL